MLKLLRTHRTTSHRGANHQSRNPKAKLTELRVIIATRGWWNVIIEAAMFVVRDNKERTLPLRTRRHCLIDAADKGAKYLPFIMKEEGVGRLWGYGLADGPLPEVYEPWESPLEKNLMSGTNIDPCAFIGTYKNERGK